ncbi:MAG: hypothetical protein QOC76_6124 [Mycobacterium sp.]|nr:hypothetical protein [Mycobacterium sp.]
MDPGTGVRLRDSLHDVTHLVFAAYQEQPSLAGQVAPNVDLLEGSLDALAAAGAALQHAAHTWDRSKLLRERMIHGLRRCVGEAHSLRQPRQLAG